ncbi:MAG: hypothetical protein JWN02_1724 [Acidobacteria bacterium]|nr:hypothetical protein [Acidobacteriota bacterium]
MASGQLTRISLATALLVAFCFPAGADFQVSGITYAPAPGRQSPLASASDGKNFFILWNDQRPAGGLYAARVSGNGQLLDRTGFFVAPQAASATVIWNGSEYLVFVADNDQTRSISLVRVSADGQSVSTPKQLIGSAVAVDNSFAAWNGRNVVLVYQRPVSGGYPLFYTALLDRDGSVLKSDVLLPAAERSRFGLSVASNGTGFLAAWSSPNSSGPEIDGVRIGADGAPVDPEPRLLASRASPRNAPLLASDGSDYLLITTGQGPRFDARRIAATGDAQPGFPLTMPDGALSPSLAGVNGGYYIAWTAGAPAGGVFGLLLGHDGQQVDPVADDISRGDWNLAHPVVASNSKDIYVAWSDDRIRPRQGEDDVLGRVVTQFSIDSLLSFAASQQVRPAVASDGSSFLAGWAEERVDEGSDVFVSRVGSDGSRIDGRGIRLSSSDMDSSPPRLIFTGGVYLAAWTGAFADSSAVMTNRFTPQGRVLDGTGTYQFIADGCMSGIDVAADTAGPLVVWSECGTGRVYAGRLSNGGVMATALSRIAVSPGGAPAENPALAWDGNVFLVVWEESVAAGTPTTFHRELHAARVSRSLQLLDPVPLVLASASDGYDVHPTIAPLGGRGFVVAWERRPSGSPSRILVRHVLDSGALPDAPMDLAAGARPAAVSDGGRTFVAWEETAASLDLVGTHVGDVGEPLPGDRIAVSTTPLGEKAIGLAPFGGGFVAVYERLIADRLAGGVYRAYLQPFPGGATGRPRLTR